MIGVALSIIMFIAFIIFIPFWFTILMIGIQHVFSWVITLWKWQKNKMYNSKYLAIRKMSKFLRHEGVFDFEPNKTEE